MNKTDVSFDRIPEQTPTLDWVDETKLLYPSVQHTMEDLKQVTGEHPEASDIQRTASGEPILTPAIINAWAAKVGFGNGKRGTFHNADTYLYLKGCNIVSREEDIDEAIATARHLTTLGAIHPESQWGTYARDDGKYQLFVVSPKLEPRSLNEAISGTYDNRHRRPMEDLSHLITWYQQIDPNFIPGQPIPEGSLLYHLNWTEALNDENWGWDINGDLFPLDVEVIRLNKLGPYRNPEPWKPIKTEGYDMDWPCCTTPPIPLLFSV